MAEDAVEQAVHHVAHHLARRQLEAGDHVFGVVVQLHAVARQAVQIEAGLKRHAPERPVEETKAHRQRRAGILQDVGGHWQALLVALALLGHKLFGGQAHAALLRDGALPALPPLENHVPFRYRRQVLHYWAASQAQIDACARLAAVLQLPSRQAVACVLPSRIVSSNTASMLPGSSRSRSTNSCRAPKSPFSANRRHVWRLLRRKMFSYTSRVRGASCMGRTRRPRVCGANSSKAACITHES